MGGGGKSGGSSVAPVTQPNVTPSPYEAQLASIAGDVYSSTDPLRKYYLNSWMDFLNPTPTLKAGAVPTSYNPIYSSVSSPGAANAAGPSMFIDPQTGQLYGNDAIRTINDGGGSNRYYINNNPGEGVPVSYVNPYNYNSSASQTQQVQTGQSPVYGADQYETRQYNPASLPGFTPAYDIGRRGLEAQYNTALGQTIAGTPRGGAMSDALNKLNLSRAESVGQLPGQISNGLIQDMLNKSYGAAFNAPTTSIAGLSAANQGYTSTQNSMINAQAQANNLQAQLNQSATNAKGSGLGALGAGVGTILGSAMGPIGSAVGGTAGGGLANGIRGKI
jgi:hypothetical protein